MKIFKYSELRIFWSSLFHLITAEGKKEFWNYALLWIVELFYSILTSNVKWNIILIKYYPPGIYLLKVNDRNTRTRCEMCSKLGIKTPEQRKWCTFFGWKFALIYFSRIFREYIFTDKISKVCIFQGDLF